MYVVKENEITDSMYLIHTGKVMETAEDQPEDSKVYPAGSYFGIVSILHTKTGNSIFIGSTVMENFSYRVYCATLRTLIRIKL